jgi:hypothetical protein
MRRAAVLILVTIAVLWPAFAGARSLERKLEDVSQQVGIQSGSAFDALAGSIADTVARSVPLISSSAGFTYRYNATTEVFERTSQTLGPLFLERPDTLGQGKFNINVSFQYVELNEFDGVSLTKLQSNDPIIIRTAGGYQATHLRYSLGLQTYATGLSFTYGVTDDLDVNLYLPILSTNMRVGVHSRTVATAGSDQVFSPTTEAEQTGYDSGTAVGVGDILLRTKYQLPRWDWLRSALGMQLRLPSGDSANFQGTGDVELSPFLYLSTVLWDRVEPHMNLGMDFNASNVSQTQARYGAGVDVDVMPTVNLNLAYLGRSQLEGTADAQDTEFKHLHNGQVVSEPLLGLDFGRKDTSDLSFGIRVVVWRSVMLFANGIYALNDSGLRNDTIIPAGGVEGTF